MSGDKITMALEKRRQENLEIHNQKVKKQIAA